MNKKILITIAVIIVVILLLVCLGYIILLYKYAKAMEDFYQIDIDEKPTINTINCIIILTTKSTKTMAKPLQKHSQQQTN